MYVNKIENTITFRIKTGYYLKRLTTETVKLFRNTKTKDENGVNVPHLEITEVVLTHCKVFNNDYQKDSIVLYTFLPNRSFSELQDISPKKFYIFKNF